MSAPAAGGTATRVWPRIVVLGLVYFVIGTVTAALSRDASSAGMRQLWRFAAWALSAVAFAAQIWYERRGAGMAPQRAALRAALAVALGGFLLAVWATAHAISIGTRRLGGYGLALVVWPAALGLVSYLVAWAAAAVLTARKRA